MSDLEIVRLATPVAKRRVLRMSYNVSQSEQSTKKLPAIRFSGQYLADLGFDVAGFFEMIINDDHSITIRPHAKKVEKKLPLVNRG